MYEETKKAPAIRFQGFTDDWEQRKLGEVFFQTSKYVNPKESNLELWSLTVENGLTPKTERYNREFLVKKEDQFKSVDHNEFIYNPMNMTLGAVDLNLTGKTVAVSGYYITMLSKDGFDSKYFSIWLKSPLAIKMYKLYATGSLIERQRVQFPTLSQIKSSVPQIEEQTKIGSFFKQLDDTIALHQRKVTLLKRLKEAYLTRMLPQNSENIPLLRFADYFDPWEQRKFEDLAESFNYGLNASAMEFDGENKYIRITDIDEYSHRFIQSGLTSPNTDLSNANDYLLKEGDILFARTGASVGKSYQYDPLDGKVYYAGFLIRARIKPEFDSSFIFQNTLTEKYNNFIKITSQRSGQPGVNAQEYANFSIMVPSRGEQVKLGNFFKQLDNAIALHQCKIEKLAKAKKVLLAAMFV